MVGKMTLYKTAKPLIYRGFTFFKGGADGIDLTLFGLTLSSTGYLARKTKMLLTHH